MNVAFLIRDGHDKTPIMQAAIIPLQRFNGKYTDADGEAEVDMLQGETAAIRMLGYTEQYFQCNGQTTAITIDLPRSPMQYGEVEITTKRSYKKLIAAALLLAFVLALWKGWIKL